MIKQLPSASAARRSLVLLLGSVTSVFLMAATGPQCARTSDTLFAPEFSAATGDNPIGFCWRDCAFEANDARSAERERFAQALGECPPGTDCRARQAALHVSIMQEITQNERECMSGCHSQGHGSGGQ